MSTVILMGCIVVGGLVLMVALDWAITVVERLKKPVEHCIKAAAVGKPWRCACSVCKAVPAWYGDGRY